MNTETEATIAALRQEVRVLTARVATLEAGQSINVDELAKQIAHAIDKKVSHSDDIPSRTVQDS